MKTRLAKRIAERRKFLSMSGQEVARKVGVTWTAYYSWENSKNTPKMKNLCKLSEALEVPPSFFIEDNISFEADKDLAAELFFKLKNAFFEMSDEQKERLVEMSYIMVDKKRGC